MHSGYKEETYLFLDSLGNLRQLDILLSNMKAGLSLGSAWLKKKKLKDLTFFLIVLKFVQF